jgi:hypothetical protein
MNKENQIEIKLYYKCKNKTVKEYSIDKNNITFGDILDYYYNDIKRDCNQFQLKSKYLFNKKILENQDIILNLLMNEHINIHNIKEIKIEIYLDQIYKIYDENLPQYNKLIIPIKNNDCLELYVYYPEKGVMDIEEYHKKIYKEYSLFKINKQSSFCNSHNYLFLSGGEDNNEIINDFWIIDNNQYSIKYLSMPSPKSNHSMINLNDEYILILGGNDTKTYLFNIEKNEFIFFENTNNTHLNPYIILFNNYIYCFSEQSEIIIAEKKLFSLDKNLWENINLSLLDSEKDNEISKGDTLLIILDNKKYYEFSPEKNTIKQVGLDDDENYEVNVSSNDKNFYKLNKYYSTCIPKNFNEEKKLYVINKKSRKIHNMNFEDKRFLIKSQYEDNLDIVNIENLLIIKCTFENEDEDIKVLKAKRKKTVLKNLESDNNDTTLENEIIINELSLLKEENYGFEHKSSKNNINLILPNNVLHEQYIHRTSGLKQKLYIDVNDLGEGIENIFTPIKKDLKSPFLINNDIKQNEESIIFEQINMENKSNDNILDLSHEKAQKRVFNFNLTKDVIDDQIISREVKSGVIPQDISFNNDINNNSTNENGIKEEKKEEKKEENKEIKIDLNNKEENKKELNYEKNNDLFLSVDAFAL